MANPLDTVAEMEPARFVAGDTVTWKRTDLANDYPVAGWALSYVFRLEGATTDFAVSTTESGDDYVAEIDAATSAGIPAGTYRWAALMTRTADGGRVTIGTGVCVVEPDPNSDIDPRSHAAKVLAAIESLIEGRATADVSSYSIAGRSLTKMTLDELMRWRSVYRNEVRQERARAEGQSRKVLTHARFNS